MGRFPLLSSPRGFRQIRTREKEPVQGFVFVDTSVRFDVWGGAIATGVEGMPLAEEGTHVRFLVLMGGGSDCPMDGGAGTVSVERVLDVFESGVEEAEGWLGVVR